MQITEVPALPSGDRPESGPMQFGDDWPGVFIRGDHAFYYAYNLKQFLDEFKDKSEVLEERWMILAVLEGLQKTLSACKV